MKPRDYQVTAVDETAKAIAQGVKRPLLLLPTASGKSIVCALMTKRILEKDKNRRVLVLCHQGHLLAQNEEKINLLAPHVRTGIYCAGQGRKDTTQEVILASRDSLANDPLACGKFDFIICDEAHMISEKALKSDKTNYGKIFIAQGEDPIVIGMTGTGWRMNRGTIWGKNKFFDSVSFNLPMSKLINDGYLCSYVLPEDQETVIDASNLSVSSTGDFRTDDLNKISMPEEIVARCIDIWQEKAADRKVSIFFCCSREHGALVTERLSERIGKDNVAYIDGQTSDKDRLIMFEKIKAGRFKAIVNIGVLTTGFDAPIIDCVVWLRATDSVSLFIQMGGRGLRTFEGKQDCLMLDMAGNFERFNSLEEPFGDSGKPARFDPDIESEKEGEENKGPKKSCKRCLMSDIAIAAKTCPYCGELFISHTDKAHVKDGVSFFDIENHAVIDENQLTQKGEACVRVTYYGPEGKHSQTLLPFRIGWPGPQHKSLYKRLKKERPLRIQKKTSKSGYPDISVVEWGALNSNDCDHEWDEFFISSTSQVTMKNCANCGVML